MKVTFFSLSINFTAKESDDYITNIEKEDTAYEPFKHNNHTTYYFNSISRLFVILTNIEKQPNCLQKMKSTIATPSKCQVVTKELVNML